MSDTDATRKQVTTIGLGYLGIGGDVDPWVDFATDILSLELVGRTETAARFKMDERAWRLSVLAGEPGLAFVGWEVQDAVALDLVERQLCAAGIEAKQATKQQAAHRGVAAYIECLDPAGNNLEFFYGAETQTVRRFKSPWGAHFVTGEQGMGHLVVGTSNYQETVDFYTRTLGFGVSDVLVGHLTVSFMGSTSRHHSIAVVGQEGTGPTLHHFMLEVDDLNAVGQAYDRCIDQGLSLVMSLGRHWNDHMTSFYVETPSGCAAELGWGGRRLDRATHQTALGTGEISFWGHRPMTDEMAQRIGVARGTTNPEAARAGKH